MGIVFYTYNMVINTNKLVNINISEYKRLKLSLNIIFVVKKCRLTYL